MNDFETRYREVCQSFRVKRSLNEYFAYRETIPDDVSVAVYYEGIIFTSKRIMGLDLGVVLHGDLHDASNRQLIGHIPLMEPPKPQLQRAPKLAGLALFKPLPENRFHTSHDPGNVEYVRFIGEDKLKAILRSRLMAWQDYWEYR